MVSRKTIQEQEAFDRRVHRLICGCTGMTISSIARKFGCGWHTVERSIRRLETSGKIRCVDGCANPRIYENGERPLDPYNTLGKAIDGGTPQSDTPPMTNGEPKSKDGKFEKTTRAHITGCYSVGIRRKGKMEKAIRDSDGYTIGYWNLEQKKLNASVYYSGAVSLNQEQIKFNANQNKYGEWTTLSVYPNPRRVYYATATVEAYRVMGEQVELVTKILSDDGWQFDGDPVFKGTMHYGEIAPELLRYAGRSFKEDFENAAIHADHSVPQGELEVYEDPFNKGRTQENINIMYDLPDRIRAIEDAVLGLYKLSKHIVTLQETNVESSKLLTEAMTNFGIIQTEQIMARAKATEDDRTGYQ